VARKEEKPSLAKRLYEWAMTVGVLVLVGGLVCAFLVAGVFILHRSLTRNEDENMVKREGASRPAAETKESALEALKRPLPLPPRNPDPTSVVARPQELADIAPAPRPAPKAPEMPKPVTPVAPKPVEAPKAPPAPAPPPAAKIPEGPPSRDLSRMDNEGFIRYWLILAPIPSEKEMAGGPEVAAERIPGEARLRPRAEEKVSVKGKEYTWKRYKASEFFIDFRKFVEGQRADDVLAYAVAYVVCEQELKDVKVLAGSNDQCRVYINGQSILQHEKSRTLERDQSIANGITLKKGENTIILKVANERNLWQGCLRFMDKNGTPIRNLQVTGTPQ
jgi:hypothetical protein